MWYLKLGRGGVSEAVEQKEKAGIHPRGAGPAQNRSDLKEQCPAAWGGGGLLGQGGEASGGGGGVPGLAEPPSPSPPPGSRVPPSLLLGGPSACRFSVLQGSQSLPPGSPPCSPSPPRPQALGCPLAEF